MEDCMYGYGLGRGQSKILEIEWYYILHKWKAFLIHLMTKVHKYFDMCCVKNFRSLILYRVKRIPYYLSTISPKTFPSNWRVSAMYFTLTRIQGKMHAFHINRRVKFVPHNCPFRIPGGTISPRSPSSIGGSELVPWTICDCSKWPWVLGDWVNCIEFSWGNWSMG